MRGKFVAKILMSSPLLFLGCHHAPPPSVEGQSAFQFIRPDVPPSPKQADRGEPTLADLKPQEVFTEAEAIAPLDEPVYPARALAGHARLTTVGVRLTVSPEGKVTGVVPSVIALTVPGPYLEDFRAAIEQAVKKGRFNPAELRQVKPEQKGKGPIYWVVIKSEAVESTVDVAFTFTASGGVLGAPAKY